MEWREARGVSDGGYTAVCTQLGLRRETLRRWVIQAEVDGGSRPGSRPRRAGPDRRARAGEPRAAPGQRDPQERRGFLRGGARPPLAAMTRLHRRHTGLATGSSRSAEILEVAPSPYYAAKARPPSARAAPRRRAQRRHRPDPRRQLRGLRRAQGLAGSSTAKASTSAVTGSAG